MFAYLEKSTENVDFDEIVDFRNANPIRYALTENPNTEVSISWEQIEFSWQSTKQTVVANLLLKQMIMVKWNATTAEDELRLKLVTVGVTTAEGIVENADFDEIVDFLNANPIRYALTVSPTIYVSYIEQFCSTAKIKIVNNHTQIRVKVDDKTIVISKSSVRRDLQFNDEDGSVFNDEYDTPSHTKKVFANMRRQGKDFLGTVTPLFPSMLASQAVEGEGSRQPSEPQHTPTTASPSHSSGPTTLVADETVHEEMGDNVERVATTAASLDAKQDSCNIIKTQSMATLNELIPQGTGSGSGPRRQDTILVDIPAQTRFDRLSKQSNDPPLLRVNTLGSEEDKENHEVGKEEKGKNSTTQEEVIQKDAETQGRYGHDFEVNTASTSITTASINITIAEHVTTASALVTTAGVFVSTVEPSTPPTTTILIEDEDLTIAQTLMKMRSVKSKEKSKEKGVSIDFLNANPIKYASTVNPTIYTSCIEQFWATAKVKTVNGEVQLQALVDGKKVIITKTSVRRDLRLEDAEGIECLPNADIFEQLALMGAKSIAWNEFSSTMASVIICLATNQKFNFSEYIFESMVKNVDSSVKFLTYPRYG
ncbi:hypothetical protein Tco_0433064 [Tanacetum coccineum]